MVYREPPPVELKCPRCKKGTLPPVDVALCVCGGIWVTAFAAEIVLTATDRTPDPITRWWRVLEPCPMCDDKMQLHGDEPGLLLGCTGHGYWIDADTLPYTGLAQPFDTEEYERRRNDETAIARATAEREHAEQARAEAKLRRARAEAELDMRENRHHYQALQREQLRPPSAPTAEERDAAFAARLDPMVRVLWSRIVELERKNAALELRIERLES